MLCGYPPSLPPCCRSLAGEAKAAACCRRRRTLMRRPSPWGRHLWLERRGRRGRWCTSAAAGRRPLVSPNPNPTRPLAEPSEPTPQPPGGSCASIGSLLSEGSGELARPAAHIAPERPSSTTTSGGAGPSTTACTPLRPSSYFSSRCAKGSGYLSPCTLSITHLAYKPLSAPPLRAGPALLQRIGWIGCHCVRIRVTRCATRGPLY